MVVLNCRLAFKGTCKFISVGKNEAKREREMERGKKGRETEEKQY